MSAQHLLSPSLSFLLLLLLLRMWMRMRMRMLLRMLMMLLVMLLLLMLLLLLLLLLPPHADDAAFADLTSWCWCRPPSCPLPPLSLFASPPLFLCCPVRCHNPFPSSSFFDH